MKSRTWMWMTVVSLFAALAMPVQARIVYTPVNVNLPTNSYYPIDLNHDGITDFYFHTFSGYVTCGLTLGYSRALWITQPLTGEGVVGTYDAYPLGSGVQIDSSQSFWGSTALMYEKVTGGHCRFDPGRWNTCYTGCYLGLKFLINGQTHYGWAELSTNSSTGVNFLYGFAYETIPFKAILTGQTMDSPDEPAMDSGSTESEVSGPATVAAQDNPSQNDQHPHHQYRLIVMGTFGGPSSSVPGPSVKIVNNRRTMIGEADTPTSDLPDCFFGDCFIQHAFTWHDGVITDLGALPGVNSSAPNFINDSGEIVGVSENGLIDPLVGGPEVNAVVWKDRRLINLGTLGGNQSFGFSLNNRGQVVGVALNAIPDPFSLFGLGTQTRAFLWQNGVMQDLGTLGGPDAEPQNVNERGQICGNSYTNSIPNPTTGIPTLDPFLWERGRMIDLGTLGGTIGFSYYLNEKGQVAGTSNLLGDLTFHPFLWSRGVLTDLGTLGGDTGQPNWLNDSGAVIGRADLPGNQIHHGFLWTNGAMTDLGTIGTDPCSVANTINSSGQIVGSSTTCQSGLHAFIWENGGPMVDLNTLVNPGSGVQLISAAYISDRGEITGDAVLPNGDTRAFLLIPCDEKHPGECEDYSMIEVATPQPGAPTKQLPTTVKQGNEMSISPVNQLRNRMMQRYHLPGQPSAQRD